jgi:hypothetical protein
VGSCHPLDAWLDRAEDTVSLGLREMACRLNGASRSFDKAAENLARTAQVLMSGELLRQVVESEGKAIGAAAKAGRLPVDWDASDCPALDKDNQPTDKTRVYLGSDGVMVPMVTDAEKQKRRQKIKVKRQKRGKKCKPLPRAKKGADLPRRGAFRWRGAKRKAALALLNYMSERDDMIRYKEFAEQGRQIGSGPTESMCKATRHRVKGRGMRWNSDNAEALMAIEALEQSGGWQAYWDSLLAQAA